MFCLRKQGPFLSIRHVSWGPKELPTPNSQTLKKGRETQSGRRLPNSALPLLPFFTAPCHVIGLSLNHQLLSRAQSETDQPHLLLSCRAAV